MSVLIKGMKMPKSSLECRLFNDPWCMAKNINQWRTAYNRPPRGEKQNDCPLIEVPPHGRLIDADALGSTLNKMGIWGDARVKGFIKSIPTVIHADKEDETWKK